MQTEDRKTRILDAALAHVVFDGWSDTTLTLAAHDAGMTADEARALFPRGARDLAAAYHRRGDNAMQDAFGTAEGLAEMRYSQKVAHLIWLRLHTVDKEVVRRGLALYALPQNAAEGAALVWGTADAIWSALGDRSEDVNWYSKRAILSAVYGACVLFWLGDTSADEAETRQFIDRRIGDVLGFEKMKARLRENPALGPFMRLQSRLLSGIHAPRRGPIAGYPGWVREDRT